MVPKRIRTKRPCNFVNMLIVTFMYEIIVFPFRISSSFISVFLWNILHLYCTASFSNENDIFIKGNTFVVLRKRRYEKKYLLTRLAFTVFIFNNNYFFVFGFKWKHENSIACQVKLNRKKLDCAKMSNTNNGYNTTKWSKNILIQPPLPDFVGDTMKLGLKLSVRPTGWCHSPSDKRVLEKMGSVAKWRHVYTTVLVGMKYA